MPEIYASATLVLRESRCARQESRSAGNATRGGNVLLSDTVLNTMKRKPPTFKKKKKDLSDSFLAIKINENLCFCHLRKTCLTDLTTLYLFIYMIVSC